MIIQNLIGFLMMRNSIEVYGFENYLELLFISFTILSKKCWFLSKKATISLILKFFLEILFSSL